MIHKKEMLIDLIFQSKKIELININGVNKVVAFKIYYN